MSTDFETLSTNGNIGYYNCCEVTQLFLRKKSDNSVINFYIIVSLEEREFAGRNHSYLTAKPIGVDRDYSLGIQRYWLTIQEASEACTALATSQSWDFGGDTSLKLGKLRQLPKQFVPSKDGNRISHVLKNNFFAGSYIVEFFDENKEYLQTFFENSFLPKLNKLGKLIQEIVPIDLSLVRERIGNVVFQFPVNILNVQTRATPTWDGVKFSFDWHFKVEARPECTIHLESKLDGNHMGAKLELYAGGNEQTVIHGSLDQVSEIKVWRNDPSLLIYKFEGSYLRHISFDMRIVSPEPRIFTIAGEEQRVQLSSSNGRGQKNTGPDYREYILNSVYQQEKDSLERTLAFKQYFSNQEGVALHDIRILIDRYGHNGIGIWDPYLSADCVLKTLFFATTIGVESRAIGSITKNVKAIYESKDKSINELISDYASILDNPGHNNNGLNLEFRVQHSHFGWPFHDRFLIFPGNALDKPRVYSLGTSINSLGKSHHILQELNHPQRVIDAFNMLWHALNHNECIVWKFPVK